jgi:SOS-response transcriptional repressor LexA
MADGVINLLRKKDNLNSRCNELADIARRQMNWQLAHDLCKQSLALCSEPSIDVQYCRAMALIYLGAFYQSTGDLENAEGCYRQSADIFSITGDEDSLWNEAVARYALGLLAQGTRDWDQAQKFYSQSLHCFQFLSEKGVDVHSPERLIKESMSRLDFLRQQKQETPELVNSVPIIGTTAAGNPIPAIEVMPEDMFWERVHLSDRNLNFKVKKVLGIGKGVTLELRPGSTYFALKVKGDSMIDAGIEDGDYVICRRQPSADPGEIIVVRINLDESTVKRFDRQGKNILLKAENPGYKPQVQIFQASDSAIQVQGKVIAVVSVLP